jgi:NAD+ synthase
MSRPDLNIVCVQANPTVGAIKANFDQIRDFRTRCPDSDLIVFSEFFGAGYPIQDLALRPGFVREFHSEMSRLAHEIRRDGGPAVLVGGPQPGADLPYNAMFLIEVDGSMHVVLKHMLPNSEVYDERRTFAEGPMPSPVIFRGYKLGIAICEDFWHGHVIRHLADAGADIIISPNGSHFRVGKQQERLALGRRHARATGLPIIYVNQVCGQDELVFDGGSYVMNAKGELLGQRGFHPTHFEVNVSARVTGVLIRLNNQADFDGNGYPESEIAQLYHAIVLGLRDYVNKNDFPGVLIGMSGGLDSALSAAVAVDALGPNRVHLVRLPSGFTSTASMEDAEAAAQLLGCRLDTVDITPAVEAFSQMTGPLFGDRPKDVTEENIQARSRGVTLMALSNKLGYMVLSTGNKSEMSVGYATLYGDMCGGFSVLKDIYKTSVFALSSWRNTCFRHSGVRDHNDFLGPRSAVIPDNIISKPPSAELSEDQTDEATLGSYEHLDAVLKSLVEGLHDPEQAAALASAAVGEPISADYARKIGRLVWHAEYKRRQGPMGVVVSGRGYDKGWRLPVTNDYGL